MSTLRIKPKPYDFKGEEERILAHQARFEEAVRNSGGRGVCPYCYQTARIIFSKITCGCIP